MHPLQRASDLFVPAITGVHLLIVPVVSIALAMLELKQRP
jgi:hypothetical protein